jgi:hypothetical protein
VAERVATLQTHGHYRISSSQGSSPISIHDSIAKHKDFQDLEKACSENNERWESDMDIGKEQMYVPREIHEEICADIVSQANVIYTTFTSSQVRKLNKRNFKPDVVIVDEAGQAPECLSWFGVLQAKKAIIVGDQNQCKFFVDLALIFSVFSVGPVVLTKEAKDANFGDSIMNYLFKEFGTKIQTRLLTQYRSNKKIMEWSNKNFYDNELQVS